MCTSSGRKAAQSVLTPGQRRGATEYLGSTFVGGRAPLHKEVDAKDVYYETRTSKTDPTIKRVYGGTSTMAPGDTTDYTKYKYQGQSGRVYDVTKQAEYTDWGGDSTNEATGNFNFRIGSGHNAYVRAGDRNAYGQTDSPAKYGVDIGKTEEEAKATYKDFGLDFMKDSARGDFYKTEKKRNPLQRQDAGGQEAARRKLGRIRAGSQQNAASAGGKLKGKKQGNLRISTAGIQGGQSGGGTSLS